MEVMRLERMIEQLKRMMNEHNHELHKPRRFKDYAELEFVKV